ncbi:MAG: TOBE domain-containing protein, partial [Candidatus Bathyarchaeota archaeon]|nr:TOBE domain-containing protein [Candidatus Bathyarchaeota archaeon]
SIREENISITSEPRGDEQNRLSGEVAAVYFLGSFIRYVVKLTNGDEIAARVPIKGVNAEIKQGDWVSISFDPTNTRVYEYPTLGLQKELEVS